MMEQKVMNKCGIFLHQSCVSRLIKGYYKSYKNWKLIYERTVEK